MKRATIAALTLAALLAFSPGVARADSGSFSTDDGQSCTYFGNPGLYQVSCSGYNWRAGTTIACEYTVMSGSVTYRCRGGNGGTWSGSR